MSITSSSVLTEMNISVWTANKLDRGATDNVTSNANAVKNAAQVRKNLMAGTAARKESKAPLRKKFANLIGELWSWALSRFFRRKRS